MSDPEQVSQMIDLLERLIALAGSTGLSFGNAERFFNVGEWHLAFEELLYSPDLEGLAKFTDENREAIQRLSSWFEIE